MRILVLGDFSGGGMGNRGPATTAIPDRRLHRVDVDNLDQVMARIAPGYTHSGTDGQTDSVSFSALDDFHPDALYRKLARFDELRELRVRLHNPGTWQDAAQQLRTLLSLQAPAAPGTGANGHDTDGAASGESDSGTLERLLGKPAGAASHARTSARSAVDRLIRAAVSDHVVADNEPGREVYLDAADRALGERMRDILQQPEFRTLESLWRGVAFLVNRLELDENLQLVLLDVSHQELVQDARQADGNPQASGLYRLLAEQGAQVPDAGYWSLLAGAFRFGPGDDDIRLLSLLGEIAAHTGAPFLAEGCPGLLGCDSLAAHPHPHQWDATDAGKLRQWNELRTSPVARWLGLALPRMLLRLPYGPDTDEVDSFGFREIDAVAGNADFLWGNPAFGAAALIGQSFTARGWQMAPGDLQDIGELPAYSYHVDGERQLLPCAEVYMTETAATAILENGLMPLLSLRNTSTARLLRFQSIANPLQALSGPWAG